MYSGMEAKLQIMRRYPEMTTFLLKAFFERDPDVCGEIQKSYQEALGTEAVTALLQTAAGEIAPGIDLELMYKEMYWASEGYLWETVQRGALDIRRLEEDFMGMIRFWERIFCRKREGEDADEGH